MLLPSAGRGPRGGGSARFDTGAYGFWSAHVRVLLGDAGVLHADELADVLLAPELYQRQRQNLELRKRSATGSPGWPAAC